LKYIVVSNTNLQYFNNEVTDYLNKGWLLAGGVAVCERLCSDTLNHLFYYQALYKPV